MQTKIYDGFGVLDITDEELDRHLNTMLNDTAPLAISSDLEQYCMVCCKSKTECKCGN